MKIASIRPAQNKAGQGGFKLIGAAIEKKECWIDFKSKRGSVSQSPSYMMDMLIIRFEFKTKSGTWSSKPTWVDLLCTKRPLDQLVIIKLLDVLADGYPTTEDEEGFEMLDSSIGWHEIVTELNKGIGRIYIAPFNVTRYHFPILSFHNLDNWERKLLNNQLIIKPPA